MSLVSEGLPIIAQLRGDPGLTDGGGIWREIIGQLASLTEIDITSPTAMIERKRTGTDALGEQSRPRAALPVSSVNR